MDTSHPTKQCTKCLGDFPALPEFFTRTKKTKDGLYQSCKRCRKQHTEQVKEKARAYFKQRYVEKHELLLQQKREYYQRTKAARKEKMAAYRLIHREAIRGKDRQYYLCHREEHGQYSAEYNRLHKEQHAASAKRWIEKNHERSLQRGRARSAVRTALRQGFLTRPPLCPECHKAEGRIEAHHFRGYEPAHYLDVIWLCRPCHEKVHHPR